MLSHRLLFDPLCLLSYTLTKVLTECKVSIFVLKIQLILQSTCVLKCFNSVAFNLISHKIVLIVIHAYGILRQTKYIHLLFTYVLDRLGFGRLCIFWSRRFLLFL